MSDSATDPLKPGAKSSEWWLTVATGIALPLLSELAGMPPVTQIMIGTVAVSYIIGRSLPKAFAALGADAGRYRAERNIALKQVAEMEAKNELKDRELAKWIGYAEQLEQRLNIPKAKP